MPLRDYALILLTVFIWGTNFVAIRWGLDDMPPLFFTGLRFLLVGIPLVFFLPKPATSWWNIVLLGFFICTLQFSLLFIAIHLGLPAGLASLVMQIQVVFTLLLFSVFFHERVTILQFLGILLAFLGFGVLAFNMQLGAQSLWPYFIAITGAFAWSCGNVVYRLAGHANRFHLTIYAALVAPLPMFVLSYFLETPRPDLVLMNISARGWWSLVYNSLFSTIIAYGVWGTLLGKHKSILVAPWALTIPIFGLVSAAILLGEHIDHYEIIASSVILSGLALSILGPEFQKRWRRKT